MELQNAQAYDVAEDEIEIDLMEIAQYLLRHIKWIALSILICAVLALGYTKLLVTPQYTASSSIYVLTSTTSITSLTDLQIGESLTADFQVIAISRPVIETVVEALSLDATYDEMLETITVTNVSDTRILTITVENPDPQLAADISNALSIALCDRIAEIMVTERPTTVETAIAAEEPVSPSTLTNVLIGALIGAVLSVGVFVVIFLLDDTIKDASDVEKRLHLNVIANIPVQPEDEEDEHSKGNVKHQTHKNISAKRKPEKEIESDFFHV